MDFYPYNEKTEEWHCLRCNISLGKENPRQLCCKYYCENEEKCQKCHLYLNFKKHCRLCQNKK